MTNGSLCNALVGRTRSPRAAPPYVSGLSDAGIDKASEINGVKCHEIISIMVKNEFSNHLHA